MILIRRALPLLSSLLLLLCLEGILMRQALFWYFLPVVLVVIVVPVGLMLNWKAEHREFWQFLVSPVTLVGSAMYLLLFLNDRNISQLLIIILIFLFGWYVENLFLFHYRTDQYQPYALEHIMLYMNLLSVFFLYASLYATRVFLTVPLPVLLGLGVLVSLLFSMQFLLSSKVSWRRGWIILVVLTLVMTELFTVVSMLPTTFFVAGLLIAIPYYLMMNITRHAVHETLSRRVYLRNVVIGGITLMVTLFIAPWS